MQEECSDCWFLIFHHNIAGGSFHDKNEVLRSTSFHKFSVLYLLNDMFKISGKFEFKLTYPGHDGFIQWTQEKNPTETYDNPIANISIDTFKSSNTFRGLSLSPDNETYIEGQYDSRDWHYAIGLFKNEFTIPGPAWAINEKVFTEVNLFLKIINPKLIYYLYRLSQLKSK